MPDRDDRMTGHDPDPPPETQDRRDEPHTEGAQTGEGEMPNTVHRERGANDADRGSER